MAYLTAGRRQAWPRRIAAKTPYHEQNAPRTMDANTGLKGKGQATGEGIKESPGAGANPHSPSNRNIPGYIPSIRRPQRTALLRGNDGRRFSWDGRDNRLRQRRR